MREILEKYSTRLVNVSGKNRSLLMKKLYKKRSFDITKLDEFNNINNKIIEFLVTRNESTLRISEDPYTWYNEKIKELKALIKKERDTDLKKEALESNLKVNINKRN